MLMSGGVEKGLGGVEVPDAWEYFQVVEAVPQYEGVTISSDWLLQIKKVLYFWH